MATAAAGAFPLRRVQSSLSTQLIKTKSLFFTSPPTQHKSFFGNKTLFTRKMSSGIGHLAGELILSSPLNCTAFDRNALPPPAYHLSDEFYHNEILPPRDMSAPVYQPKLEPTYFPGFYVVCFVSIVIIIIKCSFKQGSCYQDF